MPTLTFDGDTHDELVGAVRGGWPRPTTQPRLKPSESLRPKQSLRVPI